MERAKNKFRIRASNIAMVMTVMLGIGAIIKGKMNPGGVSMSAHARQKAWADEAKAKREAAAAEANK